MFEIAPSSFATTRKMRIAHCVVDVRPAMASTVAASLCAAMLTVAPLAVPPAFADASAEVSAQAGAAKIAGGGASTLQSGRRITITRGVNLDNTDWEGQNLKGVAFQQSVVRKANFKGANLLTASL